LPIVTALGLARLAFKIAGYRAPDLLARYGRLWLIHRGYNKRRISRMPAAVGDPLDGRDARQREERVRNADIVIPIYNNYDDTSALLEQLRQTAPQHNNLILVNDNSTDPRMSPMLNAYAEQVDNAILIENSRNLGFVRSCNRGFEQARGDVVILNTDIELPQGAVGRLISALDFSNDIATVTPFSNSAYGVGIPDLIRHNERPFDATTDQVDAAFQALSHLAPIDIPRGVGFCMALSRKVLDKIGPFSLDYGQGYGEEADFCMRARRIGYRSVIAPNAYVYHKAGQSFGGSWQVKARAGQLMFLDHHPEYVAMADAFLAASEARAAGFMGLAELARRLSDGELHAFAAVGLESAEASASASRVEIKPLGNGAEILLILKGQTYSFEFADMALAREVLQAAGIELAGGQNA
jgi:GT2 family glycosyltransferase